MDIGQLTYIIIKLLSSGAASFFAVILWSKTRETAWMLMVMGTLAFYIETVYSILSMIGIAEFSTLYVGSVPFFGILLAFIPPAFFISAFCVMISGRAKK